MKINFSSSTKIAIYNVLLRNITLSNFTSDTCTDPEYLLRSPLFNKHEA